MLIAFKFKLALACAAGLAGPLAVAPLVMERDVTDAGLRDRQAIIELHSGLVSYRLHGDFTRAGKQAAAPLVQVSHSRPLAIMQHQVSSYEYQRCVDDGACRALDRGVVVAADRPAVQVSWHDANGYANWLSRKSGETYRLPTDEEWAFAAGSKFKDDGVVIDENDPSKRWIARYEREADRARSDAGTRAFGSFGSNENGLQDLGGNVWEWTASVS
jgi:formylglycine-generating enzyme required for sulfatase activity